MLATDPLAVITGAVRSTFHVIVRLVDDVLPHISVVVHVLVCDLLQSPVTAPSLGVAVTTPSQ